MDFFLGFDGGGSKTECVLMNSEGETLASAVNGPSNPLRAGFPRAWFALGAAADAVLARQKLKASQIRGVCAGLGGAGQSRVARRMQLHFSAAFPGAAVRVTTDLEVALAAATNGGEGVVLLAGTGSAAYGCNGEGKIARAGGRGPWIGDEGSGFDIGRKALAAVVRAQDRLGPETALAGAVLEAACVTSWDALVDQIVNSPDFVFPRLFPHVAELAEKGDAVSREILTTASRQLAELAESVIGQLGIAGKVFPLAKAGGMISRSTFLDQALDEALRSAAPSAQLQTLMISPATAAARMAVGGAAKVAKSA
jgi:N-acetylglucosamine kinase-like BadF-type ATPase